MMRKMGDEVTAVELGCDAASIVCFLDTWAKDQLAAPITMAEPLAKGVTPRALDHLHCTTETQKLWNFLCGLRGPDMVGPHGVSLKERTTESVRIPLKNLCRGLAMVGRIYRPSLSTANVKGIALKQDFKAGHFMSHIYRADTAIREMFRS